MAPARPPAAYHAGERYVQERLGVRAAAERIARSIHDHVPAVAAAFLEDAPLVVVGLLDARGRPWATALPDAPGLISVPAPEAIEIAADPALLVPGVGPREGAPLGLIALDPGTRRRVRVNGRVASVAASGVRVTVEQAYANCPKYIQRRRVVAAPTGARRRQAPARSDWTATALSDRQRLAIERADTFFIASAHPDGGADVSHRGGNPGFVSASAKEISWPDYPGNRMFNTLGNLQAYPRAGLLFLDFASGRSLRVTGRARVDWTGPAGADPAVAGRRVTVSVDEVREGPALGVVFELEDLSPHNPPVR